MTTARTFGLGCNHIALKPVPVLLKVVRAEPRHRFLQEVAALRALAADARRHNVVEILFHREDPIQRIGEIGLRDEGGWPLAARQPLTDHQKRMVNDDVERALRYVHANGILHGDVSGRNVVVVPSRDAVRAVLVDFGQAQRVPKGRLLRRPVGLCDHRSPEMLQGRGYSFATDYWSWGITLLLLLVGGAISDLPPVSPYEAFTQELHDMILSAAEDASLEEATQDFRVLTAMVMIRLSPDPAHRVMDEDILCHRE